MHISIHLVAVVVVFVSWLVLVAALLYTAPVGYQNRDGFHLGHGEEVE